MKWLAIISLAALIAGCASQTQTDLLLNDQDLAELGMERNNSCLTEYYETSEFSSLAQYSICYYNITDLGSEVVVELKKFVNFNDLNGTYQYESSHLYGAEGLLAENTYGNMSRFRVNNESDFGGELNPPGVYFYHLWIVEDDYLIHVTSKGVQADKEYVEKTGQRILQKLE